MSGVSSSSGKVGRLASLVLAHAGWLVSSAAILYALVRWREAMLSAYLALRLPKNAFGLADKVGLLLLGLVGLGVIIYLQHYYTRDAATGRLGRRFLRVTVIEAAVIVLAVAIEFVVGG